MKASILTVLLCLSMAPSSALSGAEEAAAQGIFNYPPLDQPLSVIREGDVFRAEIPLHNPYPRAIRLGHTESTCVCNVLATRKDFLIPGETTILDVEIPNERISGEARQVVWIYPTDPEFEPLRINIRWQVQPMVTVDSLPPNQRELERPEDILWRDIYRLEAVEPPDGAQRLKRNMLVSTVPEEMPEGGLEITDITYHGSLWTITSRRIDKLRSLVLLRAADPEATLPQGEFEETFTIHTNHPDKSDIVIELGTKIDPDAGKAVDNPLLNTPGMGPN